ncbi:bifunctional aminoglycoside phosphotransferase/ATP-binding protein [Methylococcus sp. EFPC2]|uniref:bifunctional aminoglycoside phosphotransferase/ATP-binding protein n=1 Tax=Methylococcus sp. EFPC2 TaxID=2812648 RepID=UPI0019680F75|nr:bifunctional aminoglycoside phosphotransferase/ATP-binding protein [Methylococcus sp. EFPC2]QSA97191.1 AAA family ATPase [Methylococcus sp. EFPC2]
MTHPALPPPIEAFYRRLERECQPASVPLIETHISWVILAGDYAYKIKKPVDFGFLDFSTPERRYFFCREELRLNRRLAPGLYLDVIGIDGGPDRLDPDAPTPRGEYAVMLKRFDEDKLAVALAERGGLTEAHIDGLADALADFHLSAAQADENSGLGSPECIASAAAHNFPAVEAALTEPEAWTRLRAIRDWTVALGERLRPTLIQRKRDGHVRECHGDLHLGNLVAEGDRLVPFDCIEFSEELRWIDTLSELAFIVMDLEVRGLSELAWRLLNRYLAHTGDYTGLAVFDYYRVYRAMVRAKIACLTRQQAEEEQKAELERQCLHYLEYASRIIAKHRPMLIITHGLSGSGKSWLAHRLAAALPAVRIASDIERKRLAGYPATASTDPGLYAQPQTEATYERLRTCAGSLLQAGHNVIVDATFLKAGYRDRFRDLARQAAIPFKILDLVAPEPLLRQRIESRRLSGGDPSEATLAVLEAQITGAEPLSATERLASVEVDAGTPLDFPAVLAALDPDKLRAGAPKPLS